MRKAQLVSHPYGFKRNITVNEQVWQQLQILHKLKKNQQTITISVPTVTFMILLILHADIAKNSS